MKTKIIKDRNPSRESANTSGDRPDWWERKEKQIPAKYRTKTRLSKGESAHTSTNTNFEVLNTIQAKSIRTLTQERDSMAVERDKLREQVRELLVACKVLVDHASETYPHFESERGVRDIAQADIAIQHASEDK